MANIKKVVKLELTNDERTWLTFANVALASITEHLQNEDADCVINSETGELMEISDFNKAYAIIDYLLDGNMEIQY